MNTEQTISSLILLVYKDRYQVVRTTAVIIVLGNVYVAASIINHVAMVTVITHWNLCNNLAVQ